MMHHQLHQYNRTTDTHKLINVHRIYTHWNNPNANNSHCGCAFVRHHFRDALFPRPLNLAKFFGFSRTNVESVMWLIRNRWLLSKLQCTQRGHRFYARAPVYYSKLGGPQFSSTFWQNESVIIADIFFISQTQNFGGQCFVFTCLRSGCLVENTFFLFVLLCGVKLVWIGIVKIGGDGKVL